MSRANLKKIFSTSAISICLILVSVWAFAVDGASTGKKVMFGEICLECHADLTKAFSTNVHAKSGAYGFKDASCESCHGTTSGHVTSGDKNAVTNPAKIDGETASATCLNCHSKNKGQMFWHGSVHEGQKISCVDCHKVHGGNVRLLSKKNEIDLCVGCHSNVRADMLKRSKHPLRDASSVSGQNKMTCSSCHNAHGAKGEKLINAKSFNDKCYECHFEKRAPLLWEHSPVKEDCLTCHNAHGSSNDKMLTTKVPRLCQQCHMQGRHQTGALGTNSTYAFNRGCLNCHSQIHGSNNPSGTILQR